MTDAPERIWLDGDTEVGDCPGVRGPFENPKYASDPPIEYIRADLVPTWQPIETITRDAGSVLFFGDTRHDTGIIFCGWIAKNGSLYSAESGSFCRPTHWMPLPEPPKGGDERLELPTSSV